MQPSNQDMADLLDAAMQLIDSHPWDNPTGECLCCHARTVTPGDPWLTVTDAHEDGCPWVDLVRVVLRVGPMLGYQP